MFHIALYEPEIPQNTGNIIRLCANAGAALHVIRPLGFEPDDKKLKRAGLDYHDWAQVHVYDTFDLWWAVHADHRIFAFTTKAKQCYSSIQYQKDDVLLFGPESRGLPEKVRNLCTSERCVVIPMRAPTRSLNLSNAVAVGLYEAWRQQQFQEG